MKDSFIILIFFSIGILLGLFLELPEIFLNENIELFTLFVLIFLVGIGVGADLKAWKIIKRFRFKILLLPIATIIGTFLGVLPLIYIFKDINPKELLAISSGFGYYSISSILISQISGKTLGVIALLSNISREIITLIFTPVIVKFFGKLAPISCGGATSMDTTLPIITKSSGKAYAVISIFHGTILTILVPLLIPIILGWGKM